MSAPARTNVCPHCSAANGADGQFCQACGMALPALVSAGPRVVDGAEFAATEVGQKLQMDQLQKQAGRAAVALLAVAIIQTFFLGIWLLIANSTGRLDSALRAPAVITMFVSASAFWGLCYWARLQPLPAAIVGLVLYATLVAINMMNAMQRLSHGHAGSGLGGLGIGWLDIVILAVLSRAISGGLKYRKLAQA